MVLGFGIALGLFGAYLLVFLVPDVLITASGPQMLSLKQAAEVAGDNSHYATIEDGKWDCRTISYVRGPSTTGNRVRVITRFTEIFLTDDEPLPSTVMLVSMSGEMKCGEFETVMPTGYLTRMSGDRQQELTNDVRLTRFPEAESFLEFCGYCGTENSLIGVGFGVALALMGVVLTITGFRMGKPTSAG